MQRPKIEIIVIGGGIVGLATAYRATERFPGRKIIVVDKERTIAKHQTGHNSGVLHTGIYYRPGSLRATNCREGKQAMEAFCRQEGLPFELCGKVIVATSNDEIPRLNALFERGQANGVRCELIGPERLRELEPHAAGLAAIHVPEAGIVDYAAVCGKLAERVRDAGGEIRLGARVQQIRPQSDSVIVSTTSGDIEAAVVVNCGGLQSDRIARLSGARITAKIIPFRGEYYKLRPNAESLVRGLIYPVPDPRFPFLGVHFTKMIEGGVECGPNAVLAFAREGYSKSAINVADLIEAIAYPGFLRMAARHWRTGCGEMWRSFSKAAFVRALQRLVPDIRAEQLEPAPSGVRAQALGRDGTLIDDFVIQSDGRIVNVLNAPSPAATSSLNIGKMIAERLAGSGAGLA